MEHRSAVRILGTERFTVTSALRSASDEEQALAAAA